MRNFDVKAYGLIAALLALPIFFNSCQGDFVQNNVQSKSSGSVDSEEPNNNNNNQQPPNLDKISYSAPNGLIEGEVLFIVNSDTGASFGNGPTVLYRESGKGLSNGDPIKTTPESGVGELTYRNSVPDVEQVNELPYGIGITMGAENTSVNSTSSKGMKVIAPQTYKEFFEHNYIYWPEQHQINANMILNQIEDSGTPGTWQTKPIWNMQTDYGYTGYKGPAMDIFTGFLGWNTSSRSWKAGYVITANAKPVSTSFRESTGLVSNSTIPKTPVLRQTWIKAGPVPGSGQDSEGDYFSSAINQGLLAAYDLAGVSFTSSDATVIGWDRFTFPGFMRGFNKPLNAHYYYADIYKAIGPNSRARVEVVDSQDYSKREKVTIFDVDSWSEDTITLTIREGIFYQQGLSGQHLFLTLGSGERLYLGQL